MKNKLILGQWNAICDICGFKFKSSQLKKNWRGLYVCDADFEQRNPQDFIRVRAERIAPPWTRPDNTVTYIPGAACLMWDESCYAGLAVAGCMIAGNQRFTAQFLLDLKQGAG